MSALAGLGLGSALSGGSSPSAASQAGSIAQISQNEFMTLLLTQLQNQNPLDPISDTNFATQLAQFSQLDSLNTLNSNFSSLLQVQQLSGASNLIGRTVSYLPANSSTPLSGVVAGLAIQNGTVELTVNNTEVPLSQVNGIS